MSIVTQNPAASNPAFAITSVLIFKYTNGPKTAETNAINEKENRFFKIKKSKSFHLMNSKNFKSLFKK